jgi:hypothetical protein
VADSSYQILILLHERPKRKYLLREKASPLAKAIYEVFPRRRVVSPLGGSAPTKKAAGIIAGRLW